MAYFKVASSHLSGDTEENHSEKSLYLGRNLKP